MVKSKKSPIHDENPAPRYAGHVPLGPRPAVIYARGCPAREAGPARGGAPRPVRVRPSRSVSLCRCFRLIRPLFLFVRYSFPPSSLIRSLFIVPCVPDSLCLPRCLVGFLVLNTHYIIR